MQACNERFTGARIGRRRVGPSLRRKARGPDARSGPSTANCERFVGDRQEGESGVVVRPRNAELDKPGAREEVAGQGMENSAEGDAENASTGGMAAQVLQVQDRLGWCSEARKGGSIRRQRSVQGSQRAGALRKTREFPNEFEVTAAPPGVRVRRAWAAVAVEVRLRSKGSTLRRNQSVLAASRSTMSWQ
jgi:hypothetical protein